MSNSTTPAYVTNANYEEISCKAIKLPYDGTEDDLMPFLLRLDIQHQDEGWVPATYVKTPNKGFNLTTEFAHVMEPQVASLASDQWDAHTVDNDKHTLGHETCHAHLLVQCLLASISSNLSVTLINPVPPKYRNYGTYL